MGETLSKPSSRETEMLGLKAYRTQNVFEKGNTKGLFFQTCTVKTEMVRTKQTARISQPTHEEVKRAYEMAVRAQRQAERPSPTAALIRERLLRTPRSPREEESVDALFDDLNWQHVPWSERWWHTRDGRVRRRRRPSPSSRVDSSSPPGWHSPPRQSKKKRSRRRASPRKRPRPPTPRAATAPWHLHSPPAW